VKLRRPLSIRAGLLLLGLLSVLPALVLLVLNGMDQRRRLMDEATRDARQSAAAMATLQARITDGTRLLLATLAAMPEVRRLDIPACDALFASLLARNPLYNNIVAIDRQGEIIAAGRPTSRVNLADRLHFRAAMDSGGFSAGEYVVTRSAPTPIFPFSMAFRNDRGEVAGVLVIAIKLASYDDAFDELRLPQGSILGIVDQEGRRLYYRPRADTNPLGRPIRQEVWQVLRQGGREGEFFLPGTDGQNRFFAYQKLALADGAPAYMAFVVGLPESAVLAPARRAFLANMALLAGATGLALAVAWFFGGKVLERGLDRIAETAARIGRGDLAARTDLPHGDAGLGKAARALDATARLLAEHEAAREEALAALGQSRERMAHFAASMADCFWEIDAAGRYTHVSGKVREVLGWEPDALLGRTPFDFLAPGEEAGLRRAFEAAKARREPLGELANWRVAPDGSRRCLLTNGVPFLDAAGRFAGYRGVDKDVTERMEAERSIRESLAEKEILLKEIHHRVKNNLQIISGLLYLQEEQIADPAALVSFRESRTRIASMALVHEELYRSANLSRVRLDDYIRDLLPRIFGPDPQMPRLDVDCRLGPVSVPIEKAVPTGLVVNELLTNAAKHAFQGRQAGSLGISLEETGGTVSITVRDDGPGLPADFAPEKSGTLGMQLVANLARQLGGEIAGRNEGGAAFTLRFPV
jgi:PAS domain S-box-containing protein